jgi:ATP-binding cassette, subfamily B, bacterial
VRSQLDSGHHRGWEVLRTAVRPHRRVAALGILTGFVWTAAKLAVPVLVARTIDHGVVAEDRSALAREIALLGLVGLVGALVAALRRWYAQLLAFLVERDIRRRLVRHLYGLHLGFHQQTSTGLLLSRTGSDLLQIQQPFIGIPMLLSSLLMFLGAVVLLALVNLPLMLVALSPTALILVVAVRFTRRLGPRSEELQHRTAALSGVVQESVAGVGAVKGLGAEAVELGRLGRRSDDVYDAAIGLARTRATHLPFFDFLPAVGLIATLWLGSVLVHRGSITLGELVLFNSYVLMLVGPLRMVGMTLSQLRRAVVSASLIGELLDRVPALVEPDHPVPLPDRGGELRLEDVEFTYAGAEEPSLRGVDLVVAPGETVAVVGATGSGKSTLAALVPRLHDPTSGRVLIDGVDLRDACLDEVRSIVSVVFEDTLLFSGSIADNIRYGVPDAAAEAVVAAARAAGADDFVVELPDGYDNVVGERGTGLSGGQRQRIALARALLAPSRILVLDSATSAVDATKELEIRDALAEFTRDRTTLLIAHRAATIELADRVVVLHEGRVVDGGTHHELLMRSALYRRILARAEQPDPVDPVVEPAAVTEPGDSGDDVELVS